MCVTDNHCYEDNLVCMHLDANNLHSILCCYENHACKMYNKVVMSYYYVISFAAMQAAGHYYHAAACVNSEAL